MADIHEKIKFRAMRFNSDEWVEGGILMSMTGPEIVEPYPSLPFGCYPIKEDTLGRYSGKSDKNGVEMYEGDVSACYTDQGVLYSVVVFDEHHAGFGLSSDGKTPIEYETSFFGLDPTENEEVIGNIHEPDKLPEEVRKQLDL